MRHHFFNMDIVHMWCLKCGKDIVIMTGEEIWAFKNELEGVENANS
jgi:hypothetical protein